MKTTASTRVGAAGGIPGVALLLAAFLLLFPCSGPAEGASASSSMTVGLFIPPRAFLTVQSAPQDLIVTRDDVARGYVEVPRAMRALAQTNTKKGWILGVRVFGGPFRAVEVTGLGESAALGPDGGAVPVDYPGTNGRVPIELGYRFVLEAGAQPGAYPWPVTLTAQPR